MIKQLLCSHDYKLINSHEMLSEFDVVKLNFEEPNYAYSRRRKLITDFQCKKCGKIKRMVELTAL